MNRLVIIGSGGHGMVVADCAVKLGYEDISFVDDRQKEAVVGIPVVGTSADIEGLDDGCTDFVIGIGNNETRKKIAEKHSVPWTRLVHPSAQLGCCTEIAEGTVVLANAVVNTGAKIGKHCIINTASVVEHDNTIGDYVHISPRAALGGTVRVGDVAHIGIGATVKNNIDICPGCTVGAGAVVVKNIDEKGTYIGVPAKLLK